MFSANSGHQYFVKQLNTLHFVYLSIFSKLEKHEPLSVKDKKEIEEFKEISPLIYHLTCAFIHECEGESEKAVTAYAFATDCYAFSGNPNDFGNLQKSYKEIIEDLNNYKNKLYHFVYRIVRKDQFGDELPDINSIKVAFIELKENIHLLEHPYKEKAQELINILSNIPENEFNLDGLSSAFISASDLYYLFIQKRYSEQDWLMRHFQKLNVTESAEKKDAMEMEIEQQSEPNSNKYHWLIGELFTLPPGSIPRFIKEMSKNHLEKKDKKWRSNNNNDDSEKNFSAIGTEKFKRRLVKAKRQVTLASTPSNLSYVMPMTLANQFNADSEENKEKGNDNQNQINPQPKHHRKGSK